MDRQQAVERMKAHISIGRSHSLLWGKSMEVLQPGAIDELAEWFVDQAFQAGLFDPNGAMHFLERTDGYHTQTGEWVLIELAAQDELDMEIKYLEEYCVPCVSDYLRGHRDPATRPIFLTKEDAMTTMQRMPLYIALRKRLPFGTENSR